MIFSRIAGTGSYLPEKVVTNFDLEKRVETTHAWIVERTGIESRHIANLDESTTFMGVQAAKKALDVAGVSPKEVELIIVATCTPDKVFPSAACLIQVELGVPPCIAFDVQAACSGFIYALSIADSFIKSGKVKKALVIGSESLSRITDWDDRRTCILFGDGAGAVLLESSQEAGILSTALSADGCQKDIVYLDNRAGAFIQMQGNALFRQAVNILDQAAVKALKENNLTISDLHWFIPHQANLRIITATAKKLDLPLDRVVLTLKDQGNTSGASIPLALDAAIRDGRIQRGQNLLLEGIGGGLTWGTAVIKY